MVDRPAILLSTFNGERFVSALLDSLVAQVDIQPVVYWRDDGSTDSTPQIVRRYRTSIDLREVPVFGRLGPSASFLFLLRNAAPHHVSFHFADQDDLWDKGKVAHAHRIVTQIEVPVLFHCRQQFIDSKGLFLGLSKQSGRGSFSNALCENIAVGCTVALNHSAAQLVAKGNPTHSIMHDWWAYLVVSAVGRIEYDSSPWIQYRQHSQNAVGGNPGFVLRSMRRLKRVTTRSGGGGQISDQVSDFLNIHGHLLSDKQRSRVERLLSGRTSIPQRLKNFIAPPATRQGLVDQLLLRGLLLTNRL